MGAISLPIVLDPAERLGFDKDAVFHCALSHDGAKAFVVASHLKICDLRSGEIHIAGENHGFLGMAGDAESGRALLWTARDLYSWDYAEESSTLIAQWNADVHVDGAVPLASDQLAVLRREGPRSIVDVFRHSTGSVEYRFEPDGGVTRWIGRLGARTVACGQTAGLVELWSAPDADRPPAALTLQGHSGPVLRGAAAPDGRHLVTTAADLTIRLWAIEEGAVLRGNIAAVLEGHTDEITDIAVTPDGRRMATASRDRTIRLWSIPEGRPIKTLVDHRDWVTHLAINRAGTHMASCSEDGTIRLWDLETLECTGTAYGVSRFLCLTMADRVICAGDASGNFWTLEFGAADRPAGDEVSARRFTVGGRVQGVGYRVFAQNVARKLDIRGYVRNRPDGRVEVYAIGSGRQLADLKVALSTGPTGAQVTTVEEEDAPISDRSGFAVA